ncbi:hypothetical protein [Methylobacterium aerolatum]|uniref:TMhelix containing protein n=1 Tax=Methylobacterium aerolatum TaxID=418708 RepID=A0ABU0I1W1_9HYPH|nr:hypothetical protein [Methylobacterium aerolatum]MDQ0448592.1 hypothetical protein [Methylobacterium aerolatum]
MFDKDAIRTFGSAMTIAGAFVGLTIFVYNMNSKVNKNEQNIKLINEYLIPQKKMMSEICIELGRAVLKMNTQGAFDTAGQVSNNMKNMGCGDASANIK